MTSLNSRDDDNRLAAVANKDQMVCSGSIVVSMARASSRKDRV